MKRSGTLLTILALAFALAPAASAQKIRSAEQGAARIQFDAFPHTGKNTTVRNGDLAWSETARHADAVRLLDAVPARTRPGHTDGIDAGSLLTGYRLSSGMVWCAAPSAAAINKAAQCLRDLDNDGTFDAAQVTEWRHAGDEGFEAYVKTIIPMSKAHYEKIDAASLPATRAGAVFAGMKKGTPQFQVVFGPTRLEEPIGCTLVEAGICDFLGVRIRFTEGADKGLILTFESAADSRVFEPYRLAFPKDFG